MKRLLFALLICMTSCNHLTEGKIIGKHYEPSRTYTQYHHIYTGRVFIMVPYIIHDDEDWVITIEGDYEGEKRQETIYVSESYYDNHSIGDMWCKDGDCSYSDENNTKKRK